MSANRSGHGFVPVIMSGGSGTRLWPISRTTFPKQMCDFLGETLLDATLRRLKCLGQPVILTTRVLGLDSARALDTTLLSEDLILEPRGRNTAPAVALLCKVFQLRGWDDRITGIFPADHFVHDEKEFVRVAKFALDCAESGMIVTLGIKPDRPATGFGYIETSPEIFKRSADLQAHPVKGFKEKPNEQTAKEFIAKGCFYWNAGIFIFRVSKMIELFQKHMPELWTLMESLKPDLSNVDAIYDKIKPQSLDYGIMEKNTEQVCVPCDIGWSDLGSWDDIVRLTESGIIPKGANRAEKILTHAKGAYVYSDRPKAIAIVGIDDVIVVDTPDAILVTKKGVTQNVRFVAAELEKISNQAAHNHKFELRPWGKFEILRDEEYYKTKIITLNPGRQISYQSHTKRQEHWTIIRGKGEVILDDKIIPVAPGEHVLIKVGAKHRIRNTGSDILEFIEVQTGTYFEEDDIIRYSDDYGRR